MTSRRAPQGIFAADVRVFRLYPDGTVLDVLVKPAPGPAEAALIATWLVPDPLPAGVHATRYTRDGRHIGFSTRDRIHGTDVEVTGTYRGDALLLDLRSPGRTLRQVRFRRLWPAAR
ncbi:hypothetical protein ACFQU9_28580 [Actinomadura namibiensis]|uniref:Uncharacterized protein n=1 Tax=Actinomadura namibiensis TaxID=182080 RepID=A0A7W3LJT1_ACTNM|nr:hypothetical protein [Actinomadura namibiensis]MBA8949415.1 hypothetical protein [Actinomadura namibiensis]